VSFTVTAFFPDADSDFLTRQQCYIENGRELVRAGREALPLITFHYQN